MDNWDYIYDFRLKEENFHRLYLDFYPSLVIFARKILRQEGGAEDLVQEVFTRIWEVRRSMPVIENMSVYLYQAVKFRCLNELRDRKSHRLIEKNVFAKEDDYFEMLYAEQEIVRLVNRLIMQLPPRCREILIRSIDGFSNKEIAEQLGITEETVKKQKKIARTWIREKTGNLFFLFFLFPKSFLH